jgi:hypothetical protein
MTGIAIRPIPNGGHIELMAINASTLPIKSDGEMKSIKGGTAHT